MAGKNPDCFGHYNFEHIVQFARLRYIEGFSTVKLMENVRSEKEREEVALVCMLDIEDDIVINIQLNCRYSRVCKVKDCRARLRGLIEARLKK